VPRTTVVLYSEEDGACPFLEWLDELPVKAQAKCLLRLERLRELGHELRRPEADFLRDGIYELRISLRHIQYRILYFFHGNGRECCFSGDREGGSSAVEGDRARDSAKETI
jgi:phage-related protein